jgi:serine/threonine-protein kinase RsbW
MESTTARPPGPDDGARGCDAQLEVRPEAIVRARRLVARAAADAGLPADRIDDLLVAVSEACTNAMESQQRARVDVPLEISCHVIGDAFEVSIRDRGAGFDPNALPVRPPIADPSHLEIERGWGIQLMRQLVDDLAFDITGSGVCVRLRMHL